MYCAKCKQFGTKVIESRMYPIGINARTRTHRCDHCGHVFYTKESVVPSKWGIAEEDMIGGEDK